MDLQIYYQKIREVEAKIADEFPIVVSNETADGGKDGRKTEVPRRLGAKMIVDGLARLATKEELKAYRASAGRSKAGGGPDRGGGQGSADGGFDGGPGAAESAGAQRKGLGEDHGSVHGRRSFQHRRFAGARYPTSGCGERRGDRRDTETGAGTG